MITIKTEECHMRFKELKAGDIFSFVSDPELVYIKTNNDSIDYVCKECSEVNPISTKDFCVELATGAFFEANDWERVFLYKKAELTLSR